MTSLANDGPERKHVGCEGPSTDGMIAAMVSPVPSSRPLETHMIGIVGGIRALILVRKPPRVAGTGPRAAQTGSPRSPPPRWSSPSRSSGA